jgi:hypothetical protein
MDHDLSKRWIAFLVDRCPRRDIAKHSANHEEVDCVAREAAERRVLDRVSHVLVEADLHNAYLPALKTILIGQLIEMEQPEVDRSGTRATARGERSTFESGSAMTMSVVPTVT